jgi:transcriptional regulator with XRE-family HTH domain
MHFIPENLRSLRKKLGLTQDQFARKLGVKRSVIGAYEEGRADPRISFLMLVAQQFELSLDQLIAAPVDPKASTSAGRVSGGALRVLPIVIEKESNREKATMVPVKAAAGYLNGYGDLEYIESLPRFSLPFPELAQDKTHRIFQIEGDSMLPIPSGAYITASYVDDWRNIKHDACYIVVSTSEGIAFKRVLNNLDKGFLTLKSDNSLYDPYDVAVSDILEVWRAEGVTNFNLEERPATSDQLLLDELKQIRALIEGKS